MSCFKKISLFLVFASLLFVGCKKDTEQVNDMLTKELTLSERIVELRVDEEKIIEITDGNGDYSIKSNSDESKATITIEEENKIKIVGISEGTTIVVVKDGKNKTIDFRVTVTAINNIKLSRTEVSINEGLVELVTISAGTGGYSVKSSNPNIAQAELDGEDKVKITGKTLGHAVITITDREGKTAQINVEVIENLADNDDQFFAVSSLGVVTLKDGIKPKDLPETMKIPDNGRIINKGIFDYAGSSGCKTKHLDLNNVEEIGFEAFNWAIIESIKMDKVKILGIRAFYDCRTIKSIELNELEEVGDAVFHFCHELENISIKSIKKADDRLFMYCYKLKTIKFGYVEEFSGKICTTCKKCDNCPANLEKIIIMNDKDLPKGRMDLSDNINAKIYVPSQMLDKYKNDDNWKEYKDRIFAL